MVIRIWKLQSISHETQGEGIKKGTHSQPMRKIGQKNIPYKGHTIPYMAQQCEGTDFLMDPKSGFLSVLHVLESHDHLP